MNSEKLNWWISIVSNFGVIAGLIFLGFEIRQNSSQMSAESSYSINESINSLNEGIFSNPVLAEIVRRGEEDFESLTDLEKYQFIHFEFSRLNLAEYILDLEGEGVSDVHIDYVDYIVREFNSKPGLKSFISSIEGEYIGSPDFYERIRN